MVNLGRFRKGHIMPISVREKISRALKGVRKKPERMKRPQKKYLKIYQPEHPYADKAGYVFEHRLVMEKFLGRHMSPEEVIHHKDENTHNNAIENLMIFKNHTEHLLYEYETGIRKRKLTKQQVDDVRNSIEPSRKCAKRYGVAKSTVLRIRDGSIHKRKEE